MANLVWVKTYISGYVMHNSLGIVVCSAQALHTCLCIGGSRIFFRGGLKDEFIRMCTDCIVVKAQLLR